MTNVSTVEIAGTIDTFFATLNTPASALGTELQSLALPAREAVLLRNGDNAEAFYSEIRSLVLEFGEEALDYAEWDTSNQDTVRYVNRVFNFFRDHETLAGADTVGVFTV